MNGVQVALSGLSMRLLSFVHVCIWRKKLDFKINIKYYYLLSILLYICFRCVFLVCVDVMVTAFAYKVSCRLLVVSVCLVGIC